MYSLQIFSTTQDRLSCALCSQAPWHGGAVARGVRSARLAFCSRAAHVPSRIQAPVILPKHSPVHPRLNCFLTFNCSRVPCSEPTSSRSTARLFDLIDPATTRVEGRGELTEFEHAPTRPIHDDHDARNCCCPYHRPMLTLNTNYFTRPTTRAHNALTCVCSTACCAQSPTSINATRSH